MVDGFDDAGAGDAAQYERADDAEDVNMERLGVEARASIVTAS